MRFAARAVFLPVELNLNLTSSGTSKARKRFSEFGNFDSYEHFTLEARQSGAANLASSASTKRRLNGMEPVSWRSAAPRAMSLNSEHPRAPTEAKLFQIARPVAHSPNSGLIGPPGPATHRPGAFSFWL